MRMIVTAALVLGLTACATTAEAPAPAPPPTWVPPVAENPSLLSCALTKPIWQCALQLGLPWPYSPPILVDPG